MKPTLSLCMIATPKDAQLLDKVLLQLAPHVDEICITVNGSEKAKKEIAEIDRVARSYSATVSHVFHESQPDFFLTDEQGVISCDFSKMRSANFEQATSDYILWLDTDDLLDKPANVRKLVEQMEQKHITGAYLMYNYNHDERNNVVEAHWKLQVVKRGMYEWKGSIHEDLFPIVPSECVNGNDKSVTRIHQAKGERKQSSSDRNIRALKLLLSRQKDSPDPRLLYYLANEYVSRGQFAEAIGAIEEYLKRSGWDDERYQAYQLLATCFIELNDYDKAIEVFNQSILEKEQAPDAYFGKGYLYAEKEEYEKAKTCFALGFSIKPSATNTIIFPFKYTKLPLIAYAYCLLYTGELDKAFTIINKALAYDKKDDKALAVLEAIVEVSKKKKIAESYSMIAGYLKGTDEEYKIRQILSAVPNQIADNNIITKLQAVYLPPRQWGDKEIAYFCPPSPESWSPRSLTTKGIGGSETAVVQLSKQLAKLGWNVTVYNGCDVEAGVYDGVTYKNYWEFNPKDKFNILISWRFPALFKADIEAKLKCVDVHDVMSPNDFNAEIMKSIDLVFVKSNYHKTLYPYVPKDKFKVISNGIDLSRFKEVKKSNADSAYIREPHKCIYSSSANRGLDIVLKHWETIREAVPDATLHIFYGWKTYYEMEKNNPERVQWMKNIQAEVARLADKGVIDHGRVNQIELARQQCTSDLWLYPTYFEEINCITALEAQAAGCIPVVTNFAALKETVSDKAVKIKGDITIPDIQRMWVQEVIKTLKANTRWEGRREFVEFADNYSWDKIANQWHNALKETGTGAVV